MRRPAVRFLLTLVAAASILGVVPATSEAGIIPWAWDTMFGPVGSIQARQATYQSAYYGGGYSDGACCGTSAGAYYGPARPMFVGFRAWRRNACCGNYGYANYGYADYSGCGCSSGCGTCNTGCSSCGIGCDGGYGQSCGAGGCASGQCNVNYGSETGNASPVTPATPGGPSGYDAAGPMPPASPNSVVPAPAPGPETNDGFVPRNKAPAPAPGTSDPTKDEDFVPPKVNNPAAPAPAVDVNGNSTTVPAVEPNPVVPPKKKAILGEDDEKGSNVGPRLELEEKVTWNRTFVRTRQALAPVRVTASANRFGMFPKVAWRSTADTELAKK